MIDAEVRAAVRERANHSCEYCQLRQADLPFTRFQIEHVVPKKHLGSDEFDNLALACDRCNSHKGPNLTGIDPESGSIVSLFDPRTGVWTTNFRLVGQTIVGLTPIGRATVQVLNMNEPARVRLRKMLQADSR